MVASSAVQLCWLFAQAPTAKEMPPTTKAVALMALLGIALLGLLLVVFILLGGHWVRRIGSHRRAPPVPPDLIYKRDPPEQPPPLPDSGQSSGETFVDNLTKDTRNN
jgi:hypothetical protein